MPSEDEIGYNSKEYKKYNNGIVVFSKDNRSRCSYAKNYLLSKNVDFALLNFTQNPSHGEYMWYKLRE